MTDTSGRGGVGIRLFVSGGEVVKRTFDQIGDSGRKMWAQIALGDKSANPVIRALSIGVGEAKQAIDGLTSRAGAGGAALAAFGAAGVAAAMALAGLVIALGQTREAMSFAADLTDTSDRIGVGVEALQQWRYVADEAGVSVETFQANLEKVNGVLGAFKLGIGDAKLKPIFEELGISKADLDSIRSADDFMMMLADTLGQVEDRAAQVRLARGLGVEDSLPILRLGSERIREMKEAAEDLGVVLEQDTVKRLDEADRKMELATQQMQALTTEGLQPLATWSANAASYLAGLSVEFSNLTDRAPNWIQTLLALGRAIPGTGAIQRFGEMVVGRMVQGRVPAPGANTDAVGPVDMEALSGDLTDLAAGRGQYGSNGGGFDLQGHTGRGGRSGGGAARAAAEAERRQRDRERALDQLQRAELEAQRAAIQARFGPGGTEESALELARANVTLDLEAQNAAREALRAQLEKAGALDDEAKARLEELRIAQTELAASRDARALSERVRDLYAERLREETASERDAIDLLAIQEQMAGTARERYAIGRRILEAEQALERKLLQAEIGEDGEVTRAERRRLSDLDRRQAAEITLFDHDEHERLRDQFQGYGREIVQAIEAGRIGEYIGDRIKERLLDGALDMIFNAASGGGGKGGGGLLSSLFSFGASLLPGGRSGTAKIKARAAGGGTEAGFTYGPAEHGPELFMLGGNGHVTSAAETAKMVRQLAGRAEGGGGAGRTVHEHHYHNDFTGAVMTQDLLNQMNGMAKQAEANAVRTSVDAARRGAAQQQQSMHLLGTN